MLIAALTAEFDALDKLRAYPQFNYGDPFLPCRGLPENRARYCFWPAKKEVMPLCFVLACTVLSGGCGPATSVSTRVRAVRGQVCLLLAARIGGHPVRK